jgi:hypothetical protein
VFTVKLDGVSTFIAVDSTVHGPTAVDQRLGLVAGILLTLTQHLHTYCYFLPPPLYI